MALTYEPIATTTLSVATNNITFSSIPNTYTDLRISAVFQNTVAAYDTWLSFNNVTSGGLYSANKMGANSSAITGGKSTSISQGIPITQVGATVSPNWAFCNIDVFSYATTSYNKVLLVSTNQETNNGRVEAYTGAFRSTSAISTATLYYVDGNFAVGTTVTLYGIKAA